jgi:hypothetical protein
MRNVIKILCASTIAAGLAPQSVAYAGSYTFKMIQFAQQGGSAASGVTSKDVAVGAYWDQSGASSGFAWDKGKITVVSVPGSEGATALSVVSSKGLAAGTYNVPSTGQIAIFTYDLATGVETLLPVEAQPTYVSVAGINRSGKVVGTLASLTKHKPVDKGFQETASGIHVLTSRTYANGINDAEQIVGDMNVDGNYQGFIYQHGNYTTVNFPGATSTGPVFITDDGTVGGIYSVGEISYGFTIAGGVATSYAYPNGSETTVTGIGSNGEVVGTYADSSDVSHGFVSVGGAYYNIDPPNGSNTRIAAVNGNGTLVGWTTLNRVQTGFIALCPADQRPCTQ